jgi:hypothetical protein
MPSFAIKPRTVLCVHSVLEYQQQQLVFQKLAAEQLQNRKSATAAGFAKCWVSTNVTLSQPVNIEMTSGTSILRSKIFLKVFLLLVRPLRKHLY